MLFKTGWKMVYCCSWMLNAQSIIKVILGHKKKNHQISRKSLNYCWERQIETEGHKGKGKERGERERDRQTDRQTDREKRKQTHKLGERDSESEGQRQRLRKRERERERERERICLPVEASRRWGLAGTSVEPAAARALLSCGGTVASGKLGLPLFIF